MVVYQNLKFPKHSDRPYFFSNFVTTIDGRSHIKDRSEYDPIGSDTDFETFLDLRKYADFLIHGKHTAAKHRTIDTIAQKAFLDKRVKQDKAAVLPYFIITNHPDETLLPALIDNTMEKPFLVTCEMANVPQKVQELTNIVRMGKFFVELDRFSRYLFNHDCHVGVVEGGAHLLGSFFSENLIDEVFLTIAPKILNGVSGEYLPMNEGGLILPSKANWDLLSHQTVANEVFLRYKKA